MTCLKGYHVLQPHRRNASTESVARFWHSALPMPLYCASLLALAPAQAIELAAVWHDPTAAGHCIESWIGEQRHADLPEAAVIDLVQLYELLECSLSVARPSTAAPRLAFG